MAVAGAEIMDKGGAGEPKIERKTKIVWTPSMQKVFSHQRTDLIQRTQLEDSKL